MAQRESMNYLWAGMILIGVVYAAFTGRLPEVTNAALDSAKEAVTLCITMTGVMSFWVGLMRIAEKSGIIAGLSRRLRPILRFLFPGIPEGHVANEYIATNIIANVFGLGWAATPAGLKAMEALQELNLQECQRYDAGREGDTGRSSRVGGTKHKGSRNINGETGSKKKGNQGAKIRGADIATDEMCNFLIINISSLQLISVNIIAYRRQYGSVNPSAIVGPGIVATICSTVVAIIFCKVMSRKRRVGDAS